MFTTYQLANDVLKNKEHINADELDTWMTSVYGKFATVKVVHDESGKYVIYTDNGEQFVVSEKGVE